MLTTSLPSTPNSCLLAHGLSHSDSLFFNLDLGQKFCPGCSLILGCSSLRYSCDLFHYTFQVCPNVTFSVRCALTTLLKITATPPLAQYSHVTIYLSPHNTYYPLTYCLSCPMECQLLVGKYLR